MAKDKSGGNSDEVGLRSSKQRRESTRRMICVSRRVSSEPGTPRTEVGVRIACDSRRTLLASKSTIVHRLDCMGSASGPTASKPLTLEACLLKAVAPATSNSAHRCHTLTCSQSTGAADDAA